MFNNKVQNKAKILITLLSISMITIILSACGSNNQYDANKAAGPQLNKTITGVEAGGGEMMNTQKALDQYGLSKEGWQLKASSTAAMTSQLGKAYQAKKPIVVTGWQPHWMFEKYQLKILKDPKNLYGKAEHIDAVTHKGFKQNNPGAYKLLSQFNWTSANMSEVMMKINGGQAPDKAAKEYIKDNPDLVKKWTNGISNGHGKSVKLVNVAWDSEIASTNVVAQTFDKMGYKASIQTLEPQPMFIALSKGAADASVSIWLPTTHGQYFNQYKNQLDDAGQTLDGAQAGLVVPKYMTNINSIEDLGKNKI